MTQPPVVIVGAGIGGLVSAVELSARGVDVLLLERAAQPGGKMRQIAPAGMPMDAGPTVFTMRWVFDELFESIGSQLADHLDLQPVDVLARHAWSSAASLDLHADRTRSADAIGLFAGSEASRGYLDFCHRAEAIYRTLETPFLRGSRTSPVGLAGRVGLRKIPELMQISPFATLWQELGRHFKDERLRQLFGRYATYCGASPWLAPATLMLVAHVEQAGVWRVAGGMHRVAQCLASLARASGATLRFDAHVDEILVSGGRVSGVRLADGETIAAQAVVFNGDASALGGGLLGAPARRIVPATPPSQRSLSAVTWNLVAQTDGFPLSHHNVFFSNAYADEFDDVFRRHALPRSPTVYVCAQDRADHCDAPGTPERLLMIVNAPATGDGRAPTDEELKRCETQTLQQMAACGLTIRTSPGGSVMTTPRDFERMFPATGGALYGRASHGWMASFKRPGSRTRLPGLYLAGGSVHPGPGVPMAALSGRQATASVLQDLPSHPAPRSTAPSLPAATPGGISTP